MEMKSEDLLALINPFSVFLEYQIKNLNTNKSM